MKTITFHGKTVAIFHRLTEWKAGLDFLTPNESCIQAGTWWYPKDKTLNSHVHLPNERRVPITEETIVVLSGLLRVDLYADDKMIFHQEVLGPGDMGVLLEGGHGYQTLEDNTRVLEVKNGPFTSVEKDKRLLFP